MSHPYYYAIGMRVDCLEISGVVQRMEGWIQNRQGSNYIVIANAHDALMVHKNPGIRQAVNGGSLTVPDGMSLVLLGRFHGIKLNKRVYGPDLMLEFLTKNQKKGFKHFFYGSTQDTLDKLITNLKSMFPGLVVCGSFSPPFGTVSEEDDKKIVHLINEARPDIAWVGLGCPKQQLWMHKHKTRLKVPVMVGVGAAFDFFAKTKPQAPRWLRDHGFEWLFRLLTEPRRLWKRYLVGGPVFLYYVLLEFIQGCFYKNDTQDKSC